MASNWPQPGGDGTGATSSKMGSLDGMQQEVDGHDFQEIDRALEAAVSETKKLVIVAHTIKGKGVSFMEDDNNWHYRTPNPEELTAALAELQEIPQ